MKNVVIVGFPGAGKTTVGKSLASSLHLEFIDLDEAIEAKYHITIPHLFQKYGEFVFRQCEYQTLQEQLQKEQVLISTGGGTPCYQNAMKLIHEQSISLYLKLPEEALVERLKNSKRIRPLIQGLTDEELQQYVHENLAQRAPFYEQAHFTADGETPDVSAIAQQLLQNA